VQNSKERNLNSQTVRKTYSGGNSQGQINVLMHCILCQYENIKILSQISWKYLCNDQATLLLLKNKNNTSPNKTTSIYQLQELLKQTLQLA